MCPPASSGAVRSEREAADDERLAAEGGEEEVSSVLQPVQLAGMGETLCGGKIVLPTTYSLWYEMSTRIHEKFSGTKSSFL